MSFSLYFPFRVDFSDCLSTVTTHESPLYSTDRHIPFVLSLDPGLQLSAVRSICITLLDHDEFTWFFPRGALDGDIEDSLKLILCHFLVCLFLFVSSLNFLQYRRKLCLMVTSVQCPSLHFVLVCH